jgi:hypothetical protein
MTYNKSEVVNLENAFSAIRHDTKGNPHFDNTASSQPTARNNAYESDE